MLTSNIASYVLVLVGQYNSYMSQGARWTLHVDDQYVHICRLSIYHKMLALYLQDELGSPLNPNWKVRKLCIFVQFFCIISQF